MSPKERAKNLVYRAVIYADGVPGTDKNFSAAKKIALIAVKEILGVLFQHHEIDYWKEVKTEIEKL